MTWHPDIQNTSVVVIVPALNERISIRKVLESLLQLPVSVIVVDDHSQPALYPVIEGLPVHYLYHRTNMGQGAALQTGMEYARKINPDIIITFDADGQHCVEDIQPLIMPIIKQEADIVLGSRFLPDSPTQLSASRKVVLQLARYINFLFSGLLLSDAHNGLRALGRKAWEKINISENRMAHASEILFEIRKHHLKFAEVPVHIHYTDYSKEKGQSATDGIKILFDLILHKMFR